MVHINSSPEAPPPRIRILDARAREVETVRIGDRLTFRIEIPEDSKWSHKWLNIQKERKFDLYHSSIRYIRSIMCCHGKGL